MMVTDLSKKEAGRIGEEVARDFLIGKGFKIITCNYRKPWGEIDIIAIKMDIIHFIEVKTVTRENLHLVSREINNYRPEEQVHFWKLRKVTRTAETYMNATNDKREFQIDVVGVFLNRSKREAHCRLFEQVL